MSVLGKIIKKGLQRFPYVKSLEGDLRKFNSYTCFPPGHYYSPLVEPEEYRQQQEKSFAKSDYRPAEIHFNINEQAILLKRFADYYNEIPFTKSRSASNRFSFDNVFFTYSDAITLYSFMRIFKPAKIVEIGSGFSSALLLDINEQFFNSHIELTFIEPNPERLKDNLKAGDSVHVLEQKIQDVDPQIFNKLQAGDFLLIDTSHVSKSGSDVNHIYFNILPYLNKGVKIHIHDIFFPFEYPEKWIIKENRSWNEIFLLRAFLAYNNSFRIIFFNDFIQQQETAFIAENMPLFLSRNSTVCGGIWLEKTS